MIKGAKTIAEYAIRKWLWDNNFIMSCFNLTVVGNKGILEDSNGDHMTLVYDKGSKSVYIEEE